MIVAYLDQKRVTSLQDALVINDTILNLSQEISLKKAFILAVIILIPSISINIYNYLDRNSAKFGSSSAPLFVSFANSINLHFAGCVHWSNKESQPTKLIQYLNVDIQTEKGFKSCTLIDGSQMDGLVYLIKPQKCTLHTINPQVKTAILEYKDIIISVNGASVSWSDSSTPSKHGEVIPCWDSRINI